MGGGDDGGSVVCDVTAPCDEEGEEPEGAEGW